MCCTSLGTFWERNQGVTTRTAHHHFELESSWFPNQKFSLNTGLASRQDLSPEKFRNTAELLGTASYEEGAHLGPSPWGSGSHFPRQPQSARGTKTPLCGLAPPHSAPDTTAAHTHSPLLLTIAFVQIFIFCGNCNNSEGRAEQEEHRACWTTEDRLP